MRFLTIMFLGTVCTAFAGTYEQCRESIDSVDQLFRSEDLSNYILGNDVFAVLGRISGIMEITLISGSPLRLGISTFTTLGSESICDIVVKSLNFSSTVYIRDNSLNPDLRSIIEKKYFLGQLPPNVYCSELVSSPSINACCVYEKLQSRRSLLNGHESLDIKKMKTENFKFTSPEFSFESISATK